MKGLLLFLLISATALVAAYYAVGSVNPRGLYSTGWTDAQIIRSHCRPRLVQPEWVSSKGSVLMNWVVAETKARLVVIGVFWLGALGYGAFCEMGDTKTVETVDQQWEASTPR